MPFLVSDRFKAPTYRPRRRCTPVLSDRLARDDSASGLDSPALSIEPANRVALVWIELHPRLN